MQEVEWGDWKPFSTYEEQCGNCEQYDKALSKCNRSGRTVKPTGLCEHHQYRRMK